jgi:hypothetical protein
MAALPKLGQQCGHSRLGQEEGEAGASHKPKEQHQVKNGFHNL